MVDKEKSLAYRFPELAKEWHPTKNSSFTPQTITYGSTKKVWWICKYGHEFISTPNNRTHGRGCPYCSNNKILVGYNDLKSRFPNIAAEWDYEKNINLNPEDVFPTSKKQVWWKCHVCGTSYTSSIGHRTQGTACPNCAARDKTSFSEQVIFYYVSQVYPDAVNRYKGLFENGMEIDVFIPSLDIAIEYDGIAWHSDASAICRDSRKYQLCKDAGVQLIRIGEHNTPLGETCDFYIHCANYRGNLKVLDDVLTALSKIFPLPISFDVVADELSIKSSYYQKLTTSSLDSTHPELILEWDYEKNQNLFPSMFSRGSADDIWWKCSNGHSWKAIIANRTKGSGCPYCSRKITIPGVNDLKSTHPSLLSEWDVEKNKPLTPEMISSGSQKAVWWICSKGHSWKSIVSNRAKGAGCPYCANVKLLRGYNDLAHLHPHIVKEWNYSKNSPFTPHNVLAGSSRKVWWICSKGHEWQAEIRVRTKGSGCPYCANRKILPGFNDLQTTNPQIALEWHPSKNAPLTSQQVSAGSKKKIWWKCAKCGHDWSAAIYSRNAGRGCPVCAYRKL